MKPRILADWKEKHGESLSAKIIRGVAEARRCLPTGLSLACAEQLALVRGREWLEAGSLPAADAVRRLLAADSSHFTQQNLTALEPQLSSYLGAPERHAIPALLTPEWLCSQFDSRALLTGPDRPRSPRMPIDLPSGPHRDGAADVLPLPSRHV